MSNKTMASGCLLQIKALILTGALRPGEKIKGDYLKQLLGFGLSPIREGLSRLIESGLVEFNDNIGFNVVHISEEIIVDNYLSHIQLELLLLQESIENRTIEWEAAIMGALYQLSKIESRTTKVTYQIWYDYNDKFHSTLISNAKLCGLRRASEHFTTLVDWYHHLAYDDNRAEIIQTNHNEHKKLAQLVISGDASVACSLLEQHMRQSLHYLLLRLKQKSII